MLDQLGLFFGSRGEFDRCMESYTARLRAEGASVRIAVPSRPAASRPGLRRRLRPVADALRWVRRLPLYRAQRRLMAQPRPSVGQPIDVLVATSGARLHSERVLARDYLVALTRPFAGGPEPGVDRDIACAPRLVVHDVLLHSALWDRREECWIDGVFIADTGFVLYLGLREACALRAPLLAGLLRRLGTFRRSRGGGVLSAVRELSAAGLLLEGYRRALDGAPFKSYFLTSNNFATEVLRFHLFADHACESICEVMHGVPTILWERYIGAIRATASRAGFGDKHSSLSQLPGLPMFGALTEDVKVPIDIAINTYLNRYWLQRGEAEPDAFAARELRRLFAGTTVSDRTLVITFIGGNSQFRDPYESEALLVERLMMQHTIDVLERLGVPYVLVYTPHPCYGMEAFAGDPFLAEKGVILFQDTVFTWLVCDLAIGLLSSAVWEASYFGARGFTATVPDDGMYPALLLDLLNHPGRGGGTRLKDALTAFLERHAVGRPPCDLLERAVERARRSSGVEAGVVVAAR